MKTLLFLALTFSFSFSAMALDLRQNMRQSGAALRTISKTIKDSSKNVENAALTAKIIAHMKASKEQAPGSVGTDSIGDYKATIDIAIVNLTELQEAFLKNDNVAAANILVKVNAAKGEGHHKYK